MQKSIPCHPIKIGNWSFILPLPLSPWQNKQVIDKNLYLVVLSQSRSRPIGVSRQLVTVIGVQVWGRVDRSYAPPPFWTFCFTKIVYVLKFSPLSHSLAPPILSFFVRPWLRAILFCYGSLWNWPLLALPKVSPPFQLCPSQTTYFETIKQII